MTWRITDSIMLAMPRKFLMFIHLLGLVLSAQTPDTGSATTTKLSVAGTKLEKLGLRALVIWSTVKSSSGDYDPSVSVPGAFIVLADPVSRTYWWKLVLSQPNSTPPKPSSWAEWRSWNDTILERTYQVVKTDAGFVLFYAPPQGRLICAAASRGRYLDESQLISLVLSDYQATGGKALPLGFGFWDGLIELRPLIDNSFFRSHPDSPFSGDAAMKSIRQAAGSGGWNLELSMPNGKTVHVSLSPTFAVTGHRVAPD